MPRKSGGWGLGAPNPTKTQPHSIPNTPTYKHTNIQTHQHTKKCGHKASPLTAGGAFPWHLVHVAPGAWEHGSQQVVDVSMRHGPYVEGSMEGWAAKGSSNGPLCVISVGQHCNRAVGGTVPQAPVRVRAREIQQAVLVARGHKYANGACHMVAVSRRLQKCYRHIKSAIATSRSRQSSMYTQ